MGKKSPTIKFGTWFWNMFPNGHSDFSCLPSQMHLGAPLKADREGCVWCPPILIESVMCHHLQFENGSRSYRQELKELRHSNYFKFFFCLKEYLGNI